MLQSVKTTNFQSLLNIELEFGKFTVITGPSSSGKSALTRAMKAVTSNALDSDYITRGTSKAAVSLKTEDCTVTIERESGDSSAYKIVQAGIEKPRFARLNRQVPAEVTEALGILPSTKEVSSINFAGQFDTPYLLTEGSSSVARILGELTNVSTIFKAVKEASRRAKASSTLLNLRKKDKAQLLEDLKGFTTVTKNSKAITVAEELMTHCQELQEQISLLEMLLDDVRAAEEVLERFVELPEVPEATDVLSAHAALKTFKDVVQILVSSQQQMNSSSTIIGKSQMDVDLLEEELHNTLVAVGSCPTCNQQIVR